jgi:dihydroceramidase
MSMLVATGFVLNRIITFDVSPSTRRNRSLALLTVLTAISVYHCATDEILVHVVTFGVMVIYIGIKTRKLVQTRVTDPGEKKRVATLMNFGALSAALAYALWNIDMHLCPTVLTLRRSVGLPFGILLELHGWWHILTAIGAYIFMVLVEFLTTDRVLGEDPFLWPVQSMLRAPKTEKNK